MSESHSHLHGHLAHLRSFAAQPITFLTVCTAARRPVLANEVMHSLLVQTWRHSRELHGWAVGRYVVMPDHVHLFARPELDAASMATWIKSWKSFSARQARLADIVDSPLWQADYFDKYLRNAAAYSEKWNYVADNPVRGGLVELSEDWAYQGKLEPLRF